MTTNPIGDLAQFLTNKSRVTQAQRDLTRTSGEVATGQKADLGTALKGDFSRLTSIERTLRLTDTYIDGANLAQSMFSGIQRTLALSQDLVIELGPAVLAASGTGQTSQLLTTALGAESDFQQVVSSLNTQIGGRSPFSGAATNEPALLPAGDILDDLELLVTGAPDAATMITLVDDYFMDPTGGYETVAYQGSTTPQTGFSIGEGNRASTDITALDPGIRRTLSGLALASLMSRGAGPVDDASISALGVQSGEWMQEGYDATTTLRAGLGVIEGRAETALTQARATQTALGSERATLVSADPFEAAIELQSVQTQLETLYLLTARLQRLTLAEYL